MPTYASGPNDSDGGDPLSRTVGIDHLTLLQVSPPELVTIASETGFDAIGIRVVTAGPGEEPWPLTVGSPMLEETLRRLQDTGVQVLDVEVIRLGPEIKRQDYEAVLEVGGRLGARFINIMGDDEDLDRISDHFAQLTADAHPYGLRPLLEPMAYRPVRSLELAVRIAECSGGGGVLFDSIHFQRCGGDLTYLRSVDPALLPILQLCDAPLVQPTGLPAGIPISVEAPVLSLWETVPPVDIARRARLVSIIDAKQGISIYKKERARETLYQDCSEEDVAYAVACLCPESIALSATPLLLTQDRFGRVPRVYSETLQDRRVQRELQKKCTQLNPVKKFFC